jgi:hypothetical protein
MRTRRVVCAGEHSRAAVARDDIGDLRTVRGDHDVVGDADLCHALVHADDERQSSEESEGFAGEARCAQSRWDDGERPHTRRSVRQGYVSARTAAKITF